VQKDAAIHDAPSHTAHLTRGKIENFSWELIFHPLYMSQLALDITVWSLKGPHEGEYYEMERVVQRTLPTSLRSIAMGFYLNSSAERCNWIVLDIAWKSDRIPALTQCITCTCVCVCVYIYIYIYTSGTRPRVAVALSGD
jgi:hypothetical protein